MGVPARAQRDEIKLWDWDSEIRKFRCTHQGCDYTHDHQGAVQLHHVRKHKPYEGQEEPAGCSHQWRLLSKANPVESRAIQAGHYRVCTKCEEVE